MSIINQLDQMEKWEKELDNIDWKSVLAEIDLALMDNLAAEIGFPSYERLEQASVLVVDDFHVTHLSDGRWVWWSPTRYAKEDPIYFNSKSEIQQFIIQLLKLNEKQIKQLEAGLSEVIQTKRCRSCEHEYNPSDVDISDFQLEQEQDEFCSPECAMEFVMNEMKEGFSK